uniref:Uncharacterized protein n=1 Tax=Chlamydomonas leiostraca TaxID=1034604 RepID=A0A7S0RBH5_9CHLO|mmetsp:Transcript_18629/g.47214  ORF Transcript_18629/g.47214 Transcript_18629/m.47214 type:complete len:241 (-) Transcript_18629:607-1329(-)
MLAGEGGIYHAPAPPIPPAQGSYDCLESSSTTPSTAVVDMNMAVGAGGTKVARAAWAWGANQRYSNSQQRGGSTAGNDRTSHRSQCSLLGAAPGRPGAWTPGAGAPVSAPAYNPPPRGPYGPAHAQHSTSPHFVMPHQGAAAIDAPRMRSSAYAGIADVPRQGSADVVSLGSMDEGMLVLDGPIVGSPPAGDSMMSAAIPAIPSAGLRDSPATTWSGAPSLPTVAESSCRLPVCAGGSVS